MRKSRAFDFFFVLNVFLLRKSSSKLLENETTKQKKKRENNFYSTSASCCLVRPPFRRSSNRLPTTGQLVGPGIASRLCALDAAWGQRAASTASFSPRTHTEDVGLKCCSPKDFFFSTSTIWGTFWICALIVKTNTCVRSDAEYSECCSFFLSSKQLPSLSVLSLWVSRFLEVSHLHANIYTPRAFIPAPHRTNQGPVLHGVDVEPTIHLWIHVGRIAWPQKHRGSALRAPTSPPPPPSLYK